MTTPTPTPNYSRFHAIIAASPATGIPPRTPYQPPSYPSTHAQKPPKISNFAKALKDAEKNEVIATRQRPGKFKDKEHLIAALKQCFREGPHVDFHGSYETIDAAMTHKQRIQTLIIDIWRATGYRFTVKDHPHINNGHKTRFWCSQDEAHRSKSSKIARLPNSASKPRISSAGDAVAKTRYPCRSRLLISSRDTDLPGQRIITVRMHHHVSHEPYVDASLPPDLAQAIYDSFGWSHYFNKNNSESTSGCAVSSSNRESTPTSSNLSYPGSEEQEEEMEEDDDIDDSEEENGADDGFEMRSVSQLGGTHDFTWSNIQNHSGGEVSSGSAAQIDPQRYHQRMRAHINNIREFCDGLEYQLQFNDYRMLDVLEREGASFLRLVQDCLRKEGRLDPAGSIG